MLYKMLKPIMMLINFQILNLLLPLLKIQKGKYRQLRFYLLNSQIKKLRALMRKLDFRQGIFVMGNKSYTFSDGIFLNNNIGHRYLKVSGRDHGNEGSFIVDSLEKLKIVPKVIVDLGANAGEISLFLAKHYPNSKIIMVEPSPENLHILKDNLKINSSLTPNITLVEKAVSDKKGKITFFEGLRSESSLIKPSNFDTSSKRGKKIQVSSEPFDSILKLNNIDEVDFVKIDIEGAEPFLKKGLITVFPRSIFMEISLKNSEENYLDLLFSLIEKGYRLLDSDLNGLNGNVAIRKFVSAIFKNKKPDNIWLVR